MYWNLMSGRRGNILRYKHGTKAQIPVNKKSIVWRWKRIQIQMWNLLLQMLNGCNEVIDQTLWTLLHSSIMRNNDHKHSPEPSVLIQNVGKVCPIHIRLDFRLESKLVNSSVPACLRFRNVSCKTISIMTGTNIHENWRFADTSSIRNDIRPA